LVIHFLKDYIDIRVWIQENLFLVLVIAILVGIIPESGPHLIFVTLFAQGTLPFAILLANSIVQDGHGTLAEGGEYRIRLPRRLHRPIPARLTGKDSALNRFSSQIFRPG
jgi:hypothetical protein